MRYTGGWLEYIKVLEVLGPTMAHTTSYMLVATTHVAHWVG
jgi:hypothetical protein